MDYDYRNRPAPAHGHRPSAGSGASSFYPRVNPTGPPPPTAGRTSYQSSSAPPSSSSQLGIRVAIKPEYCIKPPPQLSPQMGEIPKSTFQFDFEFERKVLEEAEKESQNWTRIAAESQPLRIEPPNSLSGGNDSVISKYVSPIASYEAVSLAVANYGDNPSKVQEFVKGFNILREMGFKSNNAAEALAMFDNDTDKALAHLINT